jgi:hypothetical protein
MEFARSLWLRVETIHAVTYFDPVCAQATTTAGLTGFWMGYFGCRAAPMGAVGAGVVEATFFNFAPTFVRRWVPEVWDRTSPETLVALRCEAAATALRALVPEAAATADAVNPELARAVGRCSPAGRPLFAANRQVPLADDPVRALWQLCTCLREHRGDGHVAALTAAGLDGCEAHVLISLEQGNPPEDLQKTRGWTEQDWAAAVQRCVDKALVDESGALTSEGRALRASMEATTDRLATMPFADAGDELRTLLLTTLEPAALAISRSGVIRYPNPMGLPPMT